MKISKKNTSKLVISGLLAASLGLTGIGASVEKAYALDNNSTVTEDGYPVAQVDGNASKDAVAENANADESSQEHQDFLERKKLLGRMYNLLNHDNSREKIDSSEFEKVWLVKNAEDILNAYTKEIDVLEKRSQMTTFQNNILSDIEWTWCQDTKKFKVPVKLDYPSGSKKERLYYSTWTGDDALNNYISLLKENALFVSCYLSVIQNQYSNWNENVKNSSKAIENMKEDYREDHFKTKMDLISNLQDKEGRLSKEVKYLSNEINNHKSFLNMILMSVEEDESIQVYEDDETRRVPYVVNPFMIDKSELTSLIKNYVSHNNKDSLNKLKTMVNDNEELVNKDQVKAAMKEKNDTRKVEEVIFENVINYLNNSKKFTLEYSKIQEDLDCHDLRMHINNKIVDYQKKVADYKDLLKRAEDNCCSVNLSSEDYYLVNNLDEYKTDSKIGYNPYSWNGQDSTVAGKNDSDAEDPKSPAECLKAEYFSDQDVQASRDALKAEIKYAISVLEDRIEINKKLLASSEQLAKEEGLYRNTVESLVARLNEKQKELDKTRSEISQIKAGISKFYKGPEEYMF